MVDKIRPEAKIRLDYGVDGRNPYYYIEYSCPTCGRLIGKYRSATACDRCGTFYDWRDYEPRIVVTRHIEWD